MQDTTDADGASASDNTDESSVKPIKGSKPSEEYDDDGDGADADDTSSTDSESNFIVEDDNGPAIPLPPEFSMETHENIAHQFKKIFQFFVHIAVQLPKERSGYMKSKIKGEDSDWTSLPLILLIPLQTNNISQYHCK